MAARRHTPEVAEDEPPRRARIVCYLLFGLVGLCAAASVEWWPLTSFQLFSRAQEPTWTFWQVVLVDERGSEQVLRFDLMPRGYRGEQRLASNLPSLPVERRDEVCRTWAGAGADHFGIVAAGVRVYRYRGPIPTGRGPASEPTRRLESTCAGLQR